MSSVAGCPTCAPASAICVASSTRWTPNSPTATPTSNSPMTSKASSPNSAATPTTLTCPSVNVSCACSSRTCSSAPKRSPSATASPSGSAPATATSTKTPTTQRVTCARVISCVGGVASPILSNIYLDRLDKFVEQTLIPQHTRGTRRAINPAYHRVTQAIVRARANGDHAAVHDLHQRQRRMPSVQPDDPGYRRLRYIRYADDHLLGFTGPKAEAEEIKQRLAQFLREDLKLELAADKTLITHARTGAARFRGYEITVQHNDTKTTRGRRSVNGTIGLRVPRTVITAKCAQYCKRGKPARRTRLMNATDYAIIRTYGSEYQGLVQYYLLAGDVFRLNRLRRVMELSTLKTLGSKHRTTARRVAARYKVATDTPYGSRRCFQATLERDGRKPLVARFGGIPLKRQKQAVLTDRQLTRGVHPCSELITRLLHGRCELCQATDKIQVHHVGALADLATPGPPPAWAALMTQRRRTTLVVCRTCHDRIHTRQPTARTQ